MNEAPGSYARWRTAEQEDRDDDADWAFQTVFQTEVPEQPVSLEFTARTMAAVSAAAESDARRARSLRTGILAGSGVAVVAALYFGAGWAVSVASSTFTWLLDVMIAAVVRGAGAGQNGGGVWSVLGSLARAAAALATDSNVTFAMIAISVIAIAALLALQRLLGSDGESFQ